MDAIKNGLYYTGEYGPMLLWVISIFALYGIPSYFGMFLIGSVASILINYFLKGLIKQPRPNQDAFLQTIERQYRGIIGFGRYGMPSGHTQLAVFITSYVWLATKNAYLTLFYIIVCIIVMYQRVKYEFHTISQVVAGAAAGVVVASLFIKHVKKSNKTALRQKPDDNYFGEN